MKVTLAPLFQREWYAEPIERELITFLDETLYDPLRHALAEPRFNEAHKKDHSALWDAIAAGVVWYASNVFSGQFNAEISRELRAMGARRVGEGFYLETGETPMALRGILALSAQRATALHESILVTLSAIEEHVQKAPTGLALGNVVDKVVSDLQEQLVQSVSSVEGLNAPSAVPPGFSESLRETLSTHLDREIKGFTVEQTQLLRERVRKNLSDGARVDRLQKVIEADFGVGKRRARVLADQETSNLVSEFRKKRYQDLGSEEYVWQTSHDEKVRPTHGEANNHRVLDGRKFRWDNPPIVDATTGRRRHPGEDFGPCRCVARPVINFRA